MPTEKISHFLVFHQEDEHFGIYGVFNSMEDIFVSINKESPMTKVRLIHMGRIHEMDGTEIVDEIYIDEVKEFIDVGLEELTIAQENGMEEI